LLFLKKKIEVVLVLLALAGLAESCFAQDNDPYVIENGRITVFDSQSFSIGDEGKPVLERLGDYDSTGYSPMGVIHFYFEKGLRVTIDDVNGNVVYIALHYDDKARNDRIHTVSSINEVVIEGIEVDRQTSMDQFISTYQKGDYDFEVSKSFSSDSIAYIVQIKFKNGYRCALWFLESGNYFIDHIEYYFFP